MEVRCRHCGQILPLTDSDFGDREKADLACPACGQTTQVVNPMLATFRQEPTDRKLAPITSEVSPEGRLLHLPEDKEISLDVLEGGEKGTVYPVTKPRTTIGRANADVLVSDPMMSRLHCALEIDKEGVLLRDLGSTNGTLLNGRPIRTAMLSSGSTFRAGDHLFQLVISPKKP